MRNRVIVVIILLIIVFLAGFVPQYIKVKRLEKRRAHRHQQKPSPGVRADLRYLAEPLISLVGAGRFERPTPCAQGRCATRLRYAPTGRQLS